MSPACFAPLRGQPTSAPLAYSPEPCPAASRQNKKRNYQDQHPVQGKPDKPGKPFPNTKSVPQSPNTQNNPVYTGYILDRACVASNPTGGQKRRSWYQLRRSNQPISGVE